MVYKWLNSIQNILYPGICMLCGQTTGSQRDICQGCATGLPGNPKPCRCCALPLPDMAPSDSLCGACQKRQRPYDRVTAPYLYEGEVQQLHQAFKFNAKLSAGRLLAELLCDAVEAQSQPLPELLVPVPLHGSRLRERGFNQATELAWLLSKRLELPLDQFCIGRTRATAPQSGLNKRQRIENIRGAFASRHAIDATHIAIVDDVMTTGQTIEQMARVLRRSGVDRIDVWVVARRP